MGSRRVSARGVICRDTSIECSFKSGTHLSCAATLWFVVVSARRILAICLALFVVCASACIPAPQRTLGFKSLGALVESRDALLGRPSPATDPCAAAWDVRRDLMGEPGYAALSPGASDLWNAAEALAAACGPLRLLQVADASEPDQAEAVARWRSSADQELTLMCQYLRSAAGDLGQPPEASHC